MFCKFCGNPLGEEEAYCNKCGRQQKPTEGQPDAAAGQPQAGFARYYEGAAMTGGNAGGFAPVKKYEYDKKDRWFLLFAVLLGFLFCELLLFGGTGLSVPVFAVIFYACTIIYFQDKTHGPAPGGWWFLVPIVPVLACFGLFENGLLRFFNVLLLLALTALQMAAFTGSLRYPLGSMGTVADLGRTLFELPLLNMKTPVEALKVSKNEKKASRYKHVFTGLLIILPVAAVALALLSSADAAFERLLSDVGKIFSEDFGEHLGKLLLGAVFAVPLFSGLYMLRRESKTGLPKKSVPFWGDKMHGTAAATALAVMCGIYIVYFLSQIQYLFSGFLDSLPAGFTYAEYARRGFFELLMAAGINLGLIALFVLLSRKRETGIPRSVRFLCASLSLLTLLLIVSSFSKIVLYMHYYGLTLLRVYSAWFLAVLAIWVLLALVKLGREKFPVLRWGAAAFLVLYIGLNLINIDAAIPRYNIQRFQSGTLSKLDVNAFGELSDSMVPQALALLDSENEEVAQEAKELLGERLWAIRQTEEDGNIPWQKMNAATIRAKALLEEKINILEPYVRADNSYRADYRD